MAMRERKKEGGAFIWDRNKQKEKKENQEKGKMRHVAWRESRGKLPHLTNSVEKIKRRGG